jgi:ABC-2 type transport system permease protein
MIQTLVIIFFSIEVLNIVLVGSVWNVIIICAVSAITALALGILLSTFATSEFQMIQFIPIVIIPQVFFCGLFPLEGMANWLQAVGKVMPMYYAADALKGVMYKGAGFNDILYDLGILAAFAIVFIILNVFALKRYRQL